MTELARTGTVCAWHGPTTLPAASIGGPHTLRSTYPGRVISANAGTASYWNYGKCTVRLTVEVLTYLQSLIEQKALCNC